MKFVSLVIMATMLSIGASAQTTDRSPGKRTVAKIQQKTKGGKAKSSSPRRTSTENTDVTTLQDEKAHKAKWTFEQMLMRRLEIDAEEGERQQRKE